MTTTMLERRQHTAHSLQVIRLEGDEAFASLRARWDEIYAADEQAHIFVSWSWLRAWFDVTPYNWFVLAVREAETGPFVAFLPLAEAAVRWGGATLLRELHFGGKPLADYTGLVCLPGLESPAVEALANCVRDDLAWDRFQLDHVLDARLDAMVERLRSPGTHAAYDGSEAAPRMSLPGSWDAHLSEAMSAKSRYDVRRALRNSEAAAGFLLTDATEESLDKDLEALLTVWDKRWGNGTEHVLETYRHVFRRAFRNGTLWLRILWDGDTPMAVLAAFVDPVRQCVYQHVMAFDRRFAKRSPGRALVGYTIRHAIERGMRTYDFLLGDEEYKYSFGAGQQRVHCGTVIRPSVRATTAEWLLRSRNLLRRQRARLRGKLSSARHRLSGREGAERSA